MSVCFGVYLTVLLQTVYDYKSWLEPHLSPDIKYMSVPHRFKITRRSKKALLQYKQFSGSPGGWQPQLPAEVQIPILPSDILSESVKLAGGDPSKRYQKSLGYA